jgi:hypothetical protein
MENLGKLCALWLLLMQQCELFEAQFSTDVVYKEVRIIAFAA